MRLFRWLDLMWWRWWPPLFPGIRLIRSPWKRLMTYLWLCLNTWPRGTCTPRLPKRKSRIRWMWINWINMTLRKVIWRMRNLRMRRRRLKNRLTIPMLLMSIWLRLYQKRNKNWICHQRSKTKLQLNFITMNLMILMIIQRLCKGKRRITPVLMMMMITIIMIKLEILSIPMWRCLRKRSRAVIVLKIWISIILKYNMSLKIIQMMRKMRINLNNLIEIVEI